MFAAECATVSERFVRQALVEFPFSSTLTLVQFARARSVVHLFVVLSLNERTRERARIDSTRESCRFSAGLVQLLGAVGAVSFQRARRPFLDEHPRDPLEECARAVRGKDEKNGRKKPPHV